MKQMFVFYKTGLKKDDALKQRRANDKNIFRFLNGLNRKTGACFYLIFVKNNSGD